MPRTYQLTVGKVISKARALLQDDREPYRDPDDLLIGRLNDALSVLASLLPGLFSTTATHTTTAGYLQTIVTARAIELIDVVDTPVCDFATLTQFVPGWTAATPGAIKNWMRTPDNPLGFYCYPPSSGGQSLPVLLAAAPAPLTVPGDLVPIPESYEPVLVDYIASVSQLQDDEQSAYGRERDLMKAALDRSPPSSAPQNGG